MLEKGGFQVLNYYLAHYFWTLMWIISNPRINKIQSKPSPATHCAPWRWLQNNSVVTKARHSHSLFRRCTYPAYAFTMECVLMLCRGCGILNYKLCYFPWIYLYQTNWKYIRFTCRILITEFYNGRQKGKPIAAVRLQIKPDWGRVGGWRWFVWFPWSSHSTSLPSEWKGRPFSCTAQT